MRVDSHQHFWHYHPVRDAWITYEMAVLKRDFLPADFLPELRANGIDACVAVQADQSEEETLFLLDLAEKHREIAGVVGWVNLLDERVEERLEYFSHFRKLRGFRHIVQAEPDDRFLMRKEFLRGVGMLSRFGFTYDILIYARHLPVAAEFVQQFPSQKFVVDHMAKPQIKARELDDWSRGMRAIAKHPNVWCKVSGLITEADWKRWTGDDFRPYLDVVFEAFGVDRLMFGSDWPVCLLGGNYRNVKAIVDDYTQSFSAIDKENIFGGNAIRFYGLAA
ncbi:MAG TPA: amidohydrolase family protein [Terriglobales bacterium]|nr:amidohydrolase family protein [Terriglobales bacterium]